MEKIEFGALHEICSHIDKQSKNSARIVCPVDNCKSVILRPGVGTLKSFDDALSQNIKISSVNRIILPQTGKSVPNSPQESEEKDEFWAVGDVFAFENIGFSKSVGKAGLEGVRYLCCADCDFGPLGLQDTEAAQSTILISARRVKYIQEI